MWDFSTVFLFLVATWRLCETKDFLFFTVRRKIFTVVLSIQKLQREKNMKLNWYRISEYIMNSILIEIL